MDGISAVAARISEIQALVHPAPTVTRAAAPFSATAAGTTSPGHPFAAALTQAATGSAVPTAPWPTPPWPITPVPSTPVATTPVSAARSTPAPAGLSVAELQTRWGNGKIPAEVLTPIGGGHRLAAPAAADFRRLRAAAEADGIAIGVTDSYRSYDAQVDVARRKGLYSQGGLAAEPGTSSHGWGLAVDLDLDPQAQAWMRTHAAGFGFVEDTPREPWHWAYQT